MRRLSLYLDTSVLNYALGGAEPHHVAATQTMFRQVEAGLFTAYVSAVVIQEVMAAPEPKGITRLRSSPPRRS